MWILRQAEKFQCLLWIHNWDAAEVTEHQQILVAADDQINGNGYRTREDGEVIGIAKFFGLFNIDWCDFVADAAEPRNKLRRCEPL